MELESKTISALSYLLIALAVIGYFLFPSLSPLCVLALVADAVLMTRLFGSCRD